MLKEEVINSTRNIVGIAKCILDPISAPISVQINKTHGPIIFDHAKTHEHNNYDL